MYWFNVKKRPVAANVCGQVLREVEIQPTWSMAHVTMNPGAASLRHTHEKTDEVYVVTRGFGRLQRTINTGGGYTRTEMLSAGSIFDIQTRIEHMLRNDGYGTLEHLVFASPPFDPTDVHVADGWRRFNTITRPVVLLDAQDCFDGAKIVSRSFPVPDISIAYGWVSADGKEKRPHYHKKTTEWMYIVEGTGLLESGGTPSVLLPGYWIRIDPLERHVLRSDAPEDLVVVCVCSPAFDMADVYFD